MSNSHSLKGTINQILHKFDWRTQIYIVLAIVLAVTAGLLALNMPNPFKLFIIILGGLGILATIMQPEWGMVVLVFMTYTNLSDVAIEFHDMPSVAKFFVVFLLTVAIVHRVLRHEKLTGWQRPAGLLTVYGMVGVISLLYAADPSLTQERLFIYLKNVIIVITVVILLQRGVLLHRAVWALLAAGIFMGTISVYQYLTGSFGDVFWGFGQAQIRHIVGETSSHRISGPIGDSNYYAQILIPLVSLALDRLWNERSFLLRLLAAWALMASTLTIIFTYSRGAFVGLAAMLGVILIRRPPRPLTLLITILLIIPMLQLVPLEYTQRINTLTDSLSFSEDGNLQTTFDGRLSEMLAAFQVFVDNPFLGVGLGNFRYHFQRYSQQLGFGTHLEDRPAHSRYLEIMAETGLLGLTVFGIIIWAMFRGMHQARQELIQAGKQDYTEMISALAIGIFGSMMAALFLHDSFPRFFWLLVGIALSVPQIARNERENTHKEETHSLVG